MSGRDSPDILQMDGSYPFLDADDNVSNDHEGRSMRHQHSNFSRFSFAKRQRQSTVLSGRRGLTILELAVVLSILSLFVTITIPLAVKARESARETACANNLVALIRGVQNYQLTFGFYPSNGWGYRWVGEPGQGPGKDQPGSWAYSTLPYVERLRQSSLDRLDGSQSWISGVEDLLTMPNSLLRCPSRGAGALVNNNPNRVPFNARWLTTVYRTDYVANEGDRHLKTGPGPSRLSDVDTHAWPNNGIATGVMFLRSEITPQQIHDGVSNTYFLGEKYVFFRDYLTFNSAGYDQSGYVGADLDTNRCTSHPPTWDMIELSNAPNKGAQYFGSAHPKFSWFAFGDGSVRPISYNVDPEEYRSAGHRRDGNKMFADATQWR